MTNRISLEYKRLIFIALLLFFNYLIIFYSTTNISNGLTSFVMVSIIPVVSYIYLGWVSFKYLDIEIRMAVVLAVIFLFYEKIILKVLYLLFLFAGTEHSIGQVIDNNFNTLMMSFIYYIPVVLVLTMFGYILSRKIYREATQ